MKGGVEKPRVSFTHCAYEPGGINVSMEEDNWGGESKVSSPRGKKRAASEDLETEVPKQGKKASPGAPAPKGVLTASCLQTGHPPTEL